MFLYIKKRWSACYGYKHILTIAIPLILSTGSWSVQQFIDRMFLSWHSQKALAAAMPAGILNFTLICFSLGTVSYAGTFVAQYFGANDKKKIGTVLWYGIYLSLLSAIILLIFVPASPYIFRFIGHSKSLQELEFIYFRILCFGGIGPILSSSFAGFFTGQGRNWPVMWVNFFTTLVNIVLDYFLIFGNSFFPPMGIRGAAIATIVSGFISIFIYIFLIFTPANEKRFSVFSSFRWDPIFMKRFLKYGLPSGGHFFLEIMGFTGFVLILGRIGQMELAATNIAININSLAFMPMFGLGIAVSMCVGQNIGAMKPKMAAYATNSAVQLGIAYMVLCASLYIGAPMIFITPFKVSILTERVSIVLLRFVAVYCLFDTFSILYSSAIKGAGDTHFVMKIIVILSFFVLLIPVFISVVIFKSNLYVPWSFCTLYVVLIGLSFTIRFFKGKWKKMNVIETVEEQQPSQTLVKQIEQ